MCHTRTGHRADDRELRRRGRVAVGVGVRVDGKFRRSVGCSLCRLHVQRTGTTVATGRHTAQCTHTETCRWTHTVHRGVTVRRARRPRRPVGIFRSRLESPHENQMNAENGHNDRTAPKSEPLLFYFDGERNKATAGTPRRAAAARWRTLYHHPCYIASRRMEQLRHAHGTRSRPITVARRV